MAFTIGGTEFGDDATFTTAGQYAEGRADIGVPQYDYQYYSSPGTNGQQIKNNGFRSRTVSANLLFVTSSLDATQAAIDTFQSSLVPSAFSGTFDGVELQNLSNPKTHTYESGLASKDGVSYGWMRVSFAVIQVALNEG